MNDYEHMAYHRERVADMISISRRQRAARGKMAMWLAKTVVALLYRLTGRLERIILRREGCRELAISSKE